jgi:DNA repair exonuclease SbcCD nuclease subunit
MRFLHTADWHLGMTRRFLPPDAQARYADARIQAVRDMAAIAESEGCSFVLACGDIFDSNHVDRQVVVRALDAMSTFTVPLLILPGNHDPLDAGSVYRSRTVQERLPPGVRIIADSDPVAVAPGIEVIGAPWHTRRPGYDVAARALEDAPPGGGALRVMAAHGAVDALSPDMDDPDLIHVAALRTALDSGAIAYVALGDRHSAGTVDDDARIRYPGTPVSTDHGEVDPGKALVVDLDGSGAVTVSEHSIGSWVFRRLEARLEGRGDIDALEARLDGIADKQRTVVRLALVGSLSMADDAHLRAVLSDNGDLFASLTLSEGRSDLAVAAEDADLDSLGLSGYAREGAAELVERAAGGDPGAGVAQDALRLLYRLTRST